jgi:hypothetical protein
MAMRSIAPDLRSRRRCCTPLRLAAPLGSSADRSLRNSCPTLAILRLGAMRRIAQELRGPVLRSSHPHELRAALSEPLGSSTEPAAVELLAGERFGDANGAASVSPTDLGTPWWTTSEPGTEFGSHPVWYTSVGNLGTSSWPKAEQIRPLLACAGR